MLLDSGVAELLAAYARDIVDGVVAGKLNANLPNLNRAFTSCRSEVISYLAEQVEVCSKGTRTIRGLGIMIVTGSKGGIVYCLAVCDAGTPAGMVTELDDDAKLIMVSSTSDARSTNVRLASSEEVQQQRSLLKREQLAAIECRRLAAIRLERIREEQARVNKKIANLCARMTAQVHVHINACRDPRLRAELQREIPPKHVLPLETIAEICVKLGLSPHELFCESVE